MNEIFPPLRTISTSKATAGSIIRIPRSDPVRACVTDQSFDKGGRSLVILNATIEGRPSILFGDNWQNVDYCLALEGPLHFELSTNRGDVDPKGHDWWEISGVIVSVGDQFYLRVAPFDGFYGGYKLVNIRTGSLLSEPIPNFAWTFGVWRVWLRDSIAARSFSIFEFDVHKQTSK